MTSATGRIRTVLGDVAPERFGVCDAHDHLFLSSPAIPGTPLDDAEAAAREAAAFRAAGGEAIVQWSPTGTGRRAEDLARIATATGLHLVLATGRHRRYVYEHPGSRRPAFPAEEDAEALADLFVRELTEGLAVDGESTPDRPLRAGVVKVAAGYRAIDADERCAMLAAAAAHGQTRAPVCVHLELGTHPLPVLEYLGEHGVEPSGVILGHLARNPDRRLHRAVAETGAWLCLDGPSRLTHATDWRLLDVISDLVDSGHVDQLLLGADSINAEARGVTGGGGGAAALLTATAATIDRELGDDVRDALLRRNPARAYAWAG